MSTVLLRLQILTFFFLARMRRYYNLSQETSRSSDIKLIPMPDLEEISEQTEKKSSPPPILRRRKNVVQSLQRIEDTPDSGHLSDYNIIDQQVLTGNTTPSTPYKPLPFSPSQFLNTLSPEHSWPRASTPKGSSPGPLTTPQPTGLRRNQNGTYTSNLLKFTTYIVCVLNKSSTYELNNSLYSMKNLFIEITFIYRTLV